MEKEEVDDDDDDDGDWEDEGGWLPSGGNNTRQENPKNDIALKDVPYFLRKYKVRFGLATGLHFQSGLTLLKLFTLGRLICLIRGEKLICNNCFKTVKHFPPANLGQSTPDFQIYIPSVTKGSFFQLTLCV